MHRETAELAAEVAALRDKRRDLQEELSSCLAAAKTKVARLEARLFEAVEESERDKALLRQQEAELREVHETGNATKHAPAASCARAPRARGSPPVNNNN